MQLGASKHLSPNKRRMTWCRDCFHYVFTSTELLIYSHNQTQSHPDQAEKLPSQPCLHTDTNTLHTHTPCTLAHIATPNCINVFEKLYQSDSSNFKFHPSSVSFPECVTCIYCMSTDMRTLLAKRWWLVEASS